MKLLCGVNVLCIVTLKTFLGIWQYARLEKNGEVPIALRRIVDYVRAMSTDRKTTFSAITKLGGIQRIEAILDQMGTDHAITRRGVNHWYTSPRRRISGSAALSMMIVAEVLQIELTAQDFLLDKIRKPDIRAAIRRADIVQEPRR